MQINDLAIRVMLVSLVVALLPESPFATFASLAENIPFVDVLNWFIPISEILVILEAWLVVVAVYYSILFILNYVGILKS